MDPKKLHLVVLLMLIGILLACGAPPLITGDETTSAAAQTAVQPTEERPAPRSPTTPGAATAATYYVRPDGGSPDQCTGLVDAPYPGSGIGQNCAWDHPLRALPPAGPPRIAGGDTLIIASGEYMMGYGAPEANLEDDICARDYTGDCHMSPIPSGPDPAHPTRVLGAGWDSGCPIPPQLWGTQRVDLILDLTDASNIEVACLEITDRSECAEFHDDPSLACERDAYPYGEWATVGLYAEDSANVHLWNLDIHGLASAGVHAGRLTDWTVEDVRIAGNGLVGWDGDLWEGSDSNSGTLTFRRWTVEWNGCAETYPGRDPTGCWDENVGGYGDGVGTGETGGDWIIEDSAFLHNTSDGLDLLYHSLGGRVVLDRVRAEGNTGNQVKVTGQTTITNSVLVGNCAFFEGQPFTYHVEPCRAGGVTLDVSYAGGEQVSIVNSTFYGQGDGLVGGGPREAGDCGGTETLTGRNNVFLGDTDYFDPGDLTFLFYQEGCPGLEFDSDYSIYYSVKLSLYVPGSQDIAADPQLTGPFTGVAYGMALTAGSPAIDAGDDTFCPSTDIHGVARPVDGDDDGVAVCDMGAYEWWEPAARIYLPMMIRAGGLSHTEGTKVRREPKVGLPDPGPMWYNMRMCAKRPADKDELISLAEAARRYGFTHRHLRELARKGRLKAVKIARNWLTTAADVEEYIRSREQRGRYRGDIQA